MNEENGNEKQRCVQRPRTRLSFFERCRIRFRDHDCAIVITTPTENEGLPLYFRATEQPHGFEMTEKITESIRFPSLSVAISFAKEMHRTHDWDCYVCFAVDEVLRYCMYPISVSFCDPAEPCRGHKCRPFSFACINKEMA